MDRETYVSVGVLTVVILVFLYLLYIRSRAKHHWNEPYEQARIPQSIWQTYKTPQLPKRAQECQQSWTKQSGVQYHFSDDLQMTQFMRREMPTRVFKVFQSLPLGVMKADFWRYCVIFVEGGIYADIDSIALEPISKWNLLPEHKLLVALENDVHFCQWTFAAVPGHPVLKAVIDLVVRECEKGIDLSDEHFVHRHTGPGIWTRAIHQTLGYPPEQKARHTYTLYQTQPEHRRRFDAMGIRLEDRPFFYSQMVRNLYGSTQFTDDGYVSWTDQRDQLLRAAK